MNEKRWSDHYVEFRDELLKTNVGKIQRRELRAVA
jgi:acyl-coenzyme A synthetase/AMP-(fatty) acid ligase